MCEQKEGNTMTNEEILAKIRNKQRELSSRGNQDQFEKPRELLKNNSRNLSEIAKPRELLKNENIKKAKDSSRPEDEELAVEKTPSALPVDTERQGECLGVVGGDDNKSGAANTISSRTFTGISAHHSKTNKGIKIHLTLQTENDRAIGEGIVLTAELKRKDRLREIKINENDEVYFQEFVNKAIAHYKQFETPHAIGRVHDRQARSEWYPNFLVVAQMVNDIAVEIEIFYGSEKYVIPMNMLLSPKQQDCYHSGGIYGELKNKRKVPSILTAPRRSL